MADTDLPLPVPTALTQPAWDALAQGRLMYPACTCGHRWLPVSPECPNCLQGDGWAWTASSGRATVVSWVVYHVAYHPAFKDRLPYNVAIVELDEGPRLITGLLVPLAQIHIGQRVVLKVCREGEVTVARFAPAEDS